MLKIKYALIFFVFMVCTVQAGAAEPVQDIDQTLCKQDAECVVVDDACSTVWSAINRDYFAAHEKRMAEMRPVIECAVGGHGDDKKPEHAFCLSGKCAVLPPADVAKEDEAAPR